MMEVYTLFRQIQQLRAMVEALQEEVDRLKASQPSQE
jgi:prefoldin subunit 5